MDWLRHDIGARRDPKLIALKRRQGMAGLGRWWALVELLAEQDGSLEADLAAEVLADEWVCTPAKANQYLQEIVHLHLVEQTDGQYHSPRLDAEIEYFEGTHEKKVDAGRRGGLARAAKLRREDSTAIAPLEPCLSAAQAKCSTRPYQTLPDQTLPDQTIQTKPTDSPPISPSRGTGDSQTVEMPDKLPRNYASLEADLERPDPALPWREWCKGKGGQPAHAARAGAILKGGTINLAVYIPGKDGKRGRWEEQETNLDAVEREERAELLAAAMNQILLNERDRGNWRLVETRFAEALYKRAAAKPQGKRRTEAELQAEAEEAKRLRKEFLEREAEQKQARQGAGI